MTEEKRFAVLIDSDNVSFKYLKYILDEVSNYGSVTYKRIYGDFTNTTAVGWKKILLEHSITPVQQYSYTTGKNATDSAMIIDAMDILYSGSVEGFCIVSSDSDFTRLATRLRESGMTVIGMGERKTPKPFCVACNVFKYLDILADEADGHDEADDKPGEESMTDLPTLLAAMINIINENGDDQKGLAIGELGTHLLKRYPDFDVRNYGYTKLSKFLSSFDSLTLTKTSSTVWVMPREDHAGAETVRRAVVGYLKEHGGQRINLGQLNQWMTSTFPQFQVKNAGYTNFVKFINDIEGVTVVSSGRNGRIKHVVLE